jgi:TolB-like protein
MVLGFALAGKPADSQTTGKRLAVLELRGESVKGDVLDALADAVRGGAVEGLAGRGVEVITRENMRVLLREMGKTDCTEGDCEVETARNIGADYVVSGSVVRIDDAFVVTLKLHETKRGSLLATDQIDARKQLEVLRRLRERARTLLAHNIRSRPAPPPVAQARATERQEHPESKDDDNNRADTSQSTNAPAAGSADNTGYTVRLRELGRNVNELKDHTSKTRDRLSALGDNVAESNRQNMLKQSQECRSSMASAVVQVQALLDQSKRQNDTSRLICLTDQLAQMKVGVNIGDEAMQKLQEAAARGDDGACLHEFTRIRIVSQKVKILQEQGHTCAGQPRETEDEKAMDGQVKKGGCASCTLGGHGRGTPTDLAFLTALVAGLRRSRRKRVARASGN